MFGQCLLMGTGISGVSTGIYAVFTNDKNELKDRRNEYISIFSIIFIVSFIILYIFHGNSESLVKINTTTHGISSPSLGGKPPF